MSGALTNHGSGANNRTSPCAVSAIVTARSEPIARLMRLLGALAEQDFRDGIELVIAVPPEECDALVALPPSGAVRRLVVTDNPGRDRSGGLNRAIHAASAPVICRFDARTVPPPDYVRKCAERLATDPGVGIVGGVQCPRPASSAVEARGIARALSNSWLLGAPAYRRRGRSGPVDTVYLGCYRKQEILALGSYDSRLDANEDFDLAARYRRSGQAVWLESGLDVGYEARSSLGELFKQYHAFGRSKVRFWRFGNEHPNRRQVLAPVLGLFAALALALSLRNPGRLLSLLGVGANLLAALDHLSDSRDRGLSVRAVSTVASGLVLVAWLTGLARESVTGRWRPSVPSPPGAPRWRQSAPASPPPRS